MIIFVGKQVLEISILIFFRQYIQKLLYFKTQAMLRKLLMKLRAGDFQSQLSLLGIIIIHLGMGTIATWGSCNLYVFSYFHHLGQSITNSTNSIIMLITVIPMSICMLLATKLSKIYGDQRVMKVGSFIFMVSPLFALLNNLYIFVFFVLIIPTSMFSIVTVPALSSIWTQYPDAKSKVTAVIAISMGIGTAFWNTVITHAINPNNESIDEGLEGEMGFFREQVIENVLKVAVTCFTIAGFMTFVGSFLVKRNRAEQDVDKKDKQCNEQQLDNYEPKMQNQLKNEDYETHKPNEPMIQSPPTKRPQTLSDVFRDTSFILILIYILVACLYEVQLVLNLKIVYLPMIQDDHFLTYCVVILAVVGVCSAYAWGYICDKKGIGFCMLLLVILDTTLKIFSLFTNNKVMLIFLMILVGLQTKSLGTFVAPGWAQLYGIKLGTQLIPYKGIAFLLGFIVAPLFQVITSSFLTPHQYLKFLALTCVITSPIGIKFYYLTQDLHHSQKTESEQQLN